MGKSKKTNIPPVKIGYSDFFIKFKKEYALDEDEIREVNRACRIWAKLLNVGESNRFKVSERRRLYIERIGEIDALNFNENDFIVRVARVDK